jgi:hypothetical protein
MEMRVGFFAGAVGGLAIALLLVGLVAVFPQANPSAAPPPTASVQVSTATSVAGGAMAVPGSANASGASSSASRSTIIPSTNGAQAQHAPDSLLAVLPGESAGNLVGTLSPLLVGLVVAALVYAAYSRRQDASS